MSTSETEEGDFIFTTRSYTHLPSNRFFTYAPKEESGPFSKGEGESDPKTPNRRFSPLPYPRVYSTTAKNQGPFVESSRCTSPPISSTASSSSHPGGSGQGNPSSTALYSSDQNSSSSRAFSTSPTPNFRNYSNYGGSSQTARRNMSWLSKDGLPYFPASLRSSSQSPSASLRPGSLTLRSTQTNRRNVSQHLQSTSDFNRPSSMDTLRGELKPRVKLAESWSN